MTPPKPAALPMLGSDNLISKRLSHRSTHERRENAEQGLLNEDVLPLLTDMQGVVVPAQPVHERLLRRRLVLVDIFWRALGHRLRLRRASNGLGEALASSFGADVEGGGLRGTR